jgi:hypothetical protein
MEPRLERMFHSSAAGRRRAQTLPEALGLRQGAGRLTEWAGNMTEAGKSRAQELLGDTAITHLAFYAGWPNAMTAIAHLKKITEE